MKSHEGAERALAGGDRKPKGKHKVTGIHVRHASNGGYITKHEVTHEDGQPGPGNGKESIHPDMAALQAHMAQHMAQGPAEEAAEGADNKQEEAAE